MRIVYDDAKQDDFLKELYVSLEKINLKAIAKNSYGSNRINSSLVKKELNRLFCKFEILNDTAHAYNIGNNNKNSICYTTEKERQIVGFLHVNEDMFSGAYVYVTDYNGNRISCNYFITTSRIIIN